MVRPVRGLTWMSSSSTTRGRADGVVRDECVDVDGKARFCALYLDAFDGGRVGVRCGLPQLELVLLSIRGENGFGGGLDSLSMSSTEELREGFGCPKSGEASVARGERVVDCVFAMTSSRKLFRDLSGFDGGSCDSTSSSPFLAVWGCREAGRVESCRHD